MQELVLPKRLLSTAPATATFYIAVPVRCASFGAGNHGYTQHAWHDPGNRRAHGLRKAQRGLPGTMKIVAEFIITIIEAGNLDAVYCMTTDVPWRRTRAWMRSARRTLPGLQRSYSKLCTRICTCIMLKMLLPRCATRKSGCGFTLYVDRRMETGTHVMRSACTLPGLSSRYFKQISRTAYKDGLSSLGDGSPGPIPE